MGDQIFTDALGANLYGIPVLLVQPMRQDTKATIRLKRALEKPVSITGSKPNCFTLME